MRYLRMLSNSAFAGLLAAAYFTLLLLLLNPEVPLAAAGAVLTVIVLSYGLHITVVSSALYALRHVTVIPDGFLLAYGTPVVATYQGRGAVVDVAPTLLYFLGLPVARDMDGCARTDLFTPAFNEQRTITFIPTYGVQ